MISQAKRQMLAPAVGALAGAALGAVAAGGILGAIGGALVGALAGVTWVALRSSAVRAAALRRYADRLARAALVALGVTALYGLVAGTLVVLVWRPDGDWERYNWPYLIQQLLMLLVFLLSLPSLLAGSSDLLQGRRREGMRRLLAFFGPLIVFIVGDGLTPHLEIPWHQLAHTALGSAPLTLLYWFAFQRWHPAGKEL